MSLQRQHEAASKANALRSAGARLEAATALQRIGAVRKLKDVTNGRLEENAGSKATATCRSAGKENDARYRTPKRIRDVVKAAVAVSLEQCSRTLPPLDSPTSVRSRPPKAAKMLSELKSKRGSGGEVVMQLRGSYSAGKTYNFEDVVSFGKLVDAGTAKVRVLSFL